MQILCCMPPAAQDQVKLRCGQEVQWDSWPHKAGLDCLKLLRQQGRLVLVSKSEEGVLASWDPQTGRRLLCLRVSRATHLNFPKTVAGTSHAA